MMENIIRMIKHELNILDIEANRLSDDVCTTTNPVVKIVAEQKYAQILRFKNTLECIYEEIEGVNDRSNEHSALNGY